MRAPVLFSHPSSLEHDTGPHPEQPARIVAIERELAARGWLGFERRESPEAPRSLLEAVHATRHINAIQELCVLGGGMIDADTIVSTGSWEAALHAAGGAVAVVDELLGGGAPFAASLHRPPGHHAETARPMGFCLFNNIAIAARHALEAHGLRRVLIVDWDVHHGNGTEEIFRTSPEVLFCSIHQWPLYPGTGPAGDAGRGAGEGFTINLPVPAGSGDDVWCSLVEHVVVPAAQGYHPGLILISAGFDAHADDPLAGCLVTDEGFATMAMSLRALGAALSVPVGLVLEGGYALGALARGLAETLEILAGSSPVAPPQLEVHPLAAQAVQRVAGTSPFAG
jgi:acetoin utilization deacetylase AcuC-like enzyme